MYSPALNAATLVGELLGNSNAKGFLCFELANAYLAYNSHRLCLYEENNLSLYMHHNVAMLTQSAETQDQRPS